MHKVFIVCLIAFSLSFISASAYSSPFDIVEKTLLDAGVSFSVESRPVKDLGEKRTYISQSSSEIKIEIEGLAETVRDSYPYTGLSVYLGQSPLVAVNAKGQVKHIKNDDKNLTQLSNWVGYKGRFETVLLKANGGQISSPNEGQMVLVLPPWAKINVFHGRQDSSINSETYLGFDVRKLQYSHLWRPLAGLSHWIEALFKFIQGLTGFGWGLTIIVFAIVMKILMWPLSRLTKKLQSEVDSHKSALEPLFLDIKQNYKGEAAHKKVMKAYKDRGITPYYTLKPLVVTMLTLPILIAIFNMLGEVDVFQGQRFLWAHDLAYPDSVAYLPVSIPFLGNALNIMPFLMAAVTIVSTMLTRNQGVSDKVKSSQRRNLFLMTGLFFVLFYPFPVAMVFYWTLFNALQIIINQFEDKIKTS